MQHLVLALVAALSPGTSKLDTAINQIAADFHGDIAVAARNFTTGETYGLGADRRVKTASTIKVAIMVEAFSQIKEGKLHLDDAITMQASDHVPGSGILQDFQGGLKLTLEDAITLMIVESDNTATNLVIDKVGI